MNIGDYLTYFQHLPEGIRKGRNVREGYARGWGLEFGGLKTKIAADPLFVEAVRLCRSRTVVSESNLMNLYLLVRFFLPKLPRGNIIEFGSYRGGSAVFMAHVAARTLPGVDVYALDTFAGMPDTNAEIDAHQKGDFRDTDIGELAEFARKSGLTNLKLVKGTFEDTAPDVISTAGPFALAHIDCDIHSAVAFSYDVTQPAMVPGGYWVFDDATYSSCLGATEVVEDLVIRRDGRNSEQIFPHFVFRAP